MPVIGQRREQRELGNPAGAPIGLVQRGYETWRKKTVVLRIEPQRRDPRTCPEIGEGRNQAALDTARHAIAAHLQAARDIDHADKSRRPARGQRERGGTAGRDADRDDPMRVGIRPLGDRGQRCGEIVGIALEIFTEGLMHAIDAAGLWAVRQAEPAAHHRHCEPAAMGEIARLGQQPARAFLGILFGQAIAAQLLVHQPELQLAVALSAEFGAEVAGPQALLADLLLQRFDERLAAGGAVDGHAQMRERLDLLRHEVLDPVELLLELRIGLEIPGHALSPWRPI